LVFIKVVLKISQQLASQKTVNIPYSYTKQKLTKLMMQRLPEIHITGNTKIFFNTD